LPVPPVTPATIKPHLERCGYTGSRLAPDYPFNDARVPLAGFFGRPWDTRSACLAVVETSGDGKAAAARCLGLGAPTVFVCRGDVLEWWRLSADEPSEVRQFKANQIEGVFATHREELAPASIYWTKLRRPIARSRQMWFVDVGLMPAAERRAGETLHRWVEGVIQDLAERLGGQLKSAKNFADLYRTVFWLLAAKLLHDKDVDNFKRIDLSDVDEVFQRVGKHYADVDQLPPGGRAWRPSIDAAAATVAQWGYLGNTSTESLAYLYETALIDAKPRGRGAKGRIVGRDIRRELGIHSTPSVLIDHMLSQLWPLIEQHPRESRHVFEPACGHAGFLVGAMRWLRDDSGLPEGPERHRYLRDHLHGVEVEPFAAELAKLSLTLADVPYGNSWRIDNRDMFESGVLSQGASDCTVLLANPPYESFDPKQRSAYQRGGAPVSALTKGVEMLRRTLPKLPPGGVFGVVVPQGVLHDKESKQVRDFLLRECELSEISVFADNLFNEGDHEVAVIMGRRRGDHAPADGLVYRRVRERGMAAFKERLAFSAEREVPYRQFSLAADADLFLPDLPEVWGYLSALPKLDLSVHAQQGRQYWIEDKLSELGVLSKKKKAGWVPTILRANDDYSIFGMPAVVWLAPSPQTYRARGGGPKPGTRQVILNYAPVDRDPWRLKAVVDEVGLGVSSRFVVFRPKPGGPQLPVLWAILNSPIANAYAYCFSGKRETLVDEWRRFPLPHVTPERHRAIAGAAEVYLALLPSESPPVRNPKNEVEVRTALIALDAEVLRLYDLPPRLERQLLDLFTGVERKGVGCEFRGYYPPGLDAFVPLHELISEEYARSTLGRFRRYHKPSQSPEILAALRTAAEAFAEE
jgi:hypothetical protein